MPQASNALALRFEKLSVHQQVAALILAALAGTELLVLIFYSIFFEDRLALDLLLSGIIVIVVGYPLAYLFIGQNVKLRKMAVELDRAARTDELTGLPNRRTFFLEVDAAIARSDEGRGAFLYIDVDHFKQLNDTHGHAAGDSVLRRMGAVIQLCVREGDVAARLGGEEFGIYLARADRSIALLVAERLRAKVTRIGAEVGLDALDVLALRGEGDALDALMNRADRNLYRAKGSGRDRVVAELDQAA
jgi:diguanylate cyclase